MRLNCYHGEGASRLEPQKVPMGGGYGLSLPKMPSWQALDRLDRWEVHATQNGSAFPSQQRGQPPCVGKGITE
jgi:hypothetical protein